VIDYEEWFRQQLEEFRDDPEFVADGVSLEIISGIHQAMQRQGLTKKQLAERVGVSPAFISQVLNGKPNLTLLTLAKFCIALGLDCHIELRPRPPAADAEATPQRATPRKRQAQPPARPKPRRAARTAT